MSLQTVIEIVY